MKKIKTFLKENWKEIIKDTLILIAFYFLVFYQFPYYIYTPGGIIDVSSRVNIKNVTSKDKGTYNLSYVSVVNGNALNLLAAQFKKTWEIVPEKDITYEDMDYSETLKIERFLYQNAIDNASIVAYLKAGKTVEVKKTKLIIYGFEKNCNTKLETLDEIIKLDNKEIVSTDEIRDKINSKKVGETIRFTVLRNNKELEIDTKIYKSENKKIIGIYVLEMPEYSLDPEITVRKKDTEAGSSGGFMTALAIYDKLIPEDLTHGKTIVGTGTIDIDGNVGEIGGIKFKLLGASNSNVDIFFVPKDNYKEAKEVYDEYKFKFKLVKISTFDEAIEYLNNLK